MRILFVILFLSGSFLVSAQEERDTVLSRCPVFITDTVSVNNFFLEFQPSTVKVYRPHGRLQIQVQQRDQFFTLFFKDKKLKNGKYKIVTMNLGKNEVQAKYSFRSGQSASFVDVSQGYVETFYDKEKKHWNIKVNGMLSNLSSSTVTYYRVRADFYVK